LVVDATFSKTSTAQIPQDVLEFKDQLIVTVPADAFGSVLAQALQSLQFEYILSVCSEPTVGVLNVSIKESTTMELSLVVVTLTDGELDVPLAVEFAETPSVWSAPVKEIAQAL
jgi:hypothetical protein